MTQVPTAQDISNLQAGLFFAFSGNGDKHKASAKWESHAIVGTAL